MSIRTIKELNKSPTEKKTHCVREAPYEELGFLGTVVELVGEELPHELLVGRCGDLVEEATGEKVEPFGPFGSALFLLALLFNFEVAGGGSRAREGGD